MMLQKYGKMVISLLNFKGWKDEQPASDFLVVPMCKFHPQFLGPSKHLPGLDVLGGYMAFYPLSSGQGDIAGNWTLGFKLISGRFLGIAKCPQDKMWKSPQSNKNHGKKGTPLQKSSKNPVELPDDAFGHFHWTIAVEGHRLTSRSNDSR